MQTNSAPASASRAPCRLLGLRATLDWLARMYAAHSWEQPGSGSSRVAGLGSSSGSRLRLRLGSGCWALARAQRPAARGQRPAASMASMASTACSGQDMQDTSGQLRACCSPGSRRPEAKRVGCSPEGTGKGDQRTRRLGRGCTEQHHAPHVARQPWPACQDIIDSA